MLLLHFLASKSRTATILFVTEHDIFWGIGIIGGSPPMRQQVLSGLVASDCWPLCYLRRDYEWALVADQTKRCCCQPTCLEGLALTSLLVHLAIVDVMFGFLVVLHTHTVYICPVLINETSSGVKRDWVETIRDPRCTGNSAHTVHMYPGLINKTLIKH